MSNGELNTEDLSFHTYNTDFAAFSLLSRRFQNHTHLNSCDQDKQKALTAPRMDGTLSGLQMI